MVRVIHITSVFVAILVVACSEVPEDDGGAGEYDIEVPAEPTYHADVAPLMQQHCTGCHTEDAIAPFALETYDDVTAVSSIAEHAMTTGQMPPWPPDDECADFRGERRMVPPEIEIFQRWNEQGMVEGDPSDAPVDTDEDTDGVDFSKLDPDLTVDTSVEYTPQPPPGNDDDYRCFVVDPDLNGDRYVRAVDARPGNDEIVHHLIAYTAPAEADDEIAELKAEDDRPGYECFGSPRYSGSRMVAGWVPGAEPVPLEEGHGVRIPEDDRLVIQMHYTTLNDPDGSDRTEIDFYFVDEEQHPDPVELVIMRLANMDMVIDAGDPEAVVTAETPLIPKSVRVHGVAPHMHLLGTSVRVEATTGEGDMCLVNVPEWRFHWQGLYLYEEPMVLPRPFRVKLTCEYDNSAENQPNGQDPREVTWGDESRDEMCVALLVVEVPEDLEF